MTANTETPEWVAYSRWLDADVVIRYGRASQTGFLQGYRAAVAEAGPSWKTLTPAQQLEHIEFCTTCIFCEVGRAFGRCVRCGDVKEAMPPHGESPCCGSPVALGSAA